MKQTPPTNNTPIKLQVSQKSFQNYCTRIVERKSTSPSGRHCGHYKSINENKSIMNKLHAVIDFTLRTDHVLPQWRDIYHTTLEKAVNTPKIHRLRNVWIVEAHLNFVMSYVWGKRLSKNE